MKAVLCSIVVSAALLTGCSGKPSPEAEVTCLASDEVSYSQTLGGPPAFILVSKPVAANDPGSGGAVPANGIVATVTSPVENIQICKGDCTDGSGSFETEKDVETNDDALLQYTLGLDPSSSVSVTIIESFNALSSCTTDVTIQTI